MVETVAKVVCKAIRQMNEIMKEWQKMMMRVVWMLQYVWVGYIVPMTNLIQVMTQRKAVEKGKTCTVELCHHSMASTVWNGIGIHDVHCQSISARKGKLPSLGQVSLLA